MSSRPLAIMTLISLLCVRSYSQQGAPSSNAGESAVTLAINRIRPSVVQVMYTVQYAYMTPGGPKAVAADSLPAPMGSGFLADATHVITARHVVEAIESLKTDLTSRPVGADGPIDPQSIKIQIFVGFASQQSLADHSLILGNFITVPTTIVGRSETADVAILQIAPGALDNVAKTRPITIGKATSQPIKPVIPKLANGLADEGEMIGASGFPLRMPSLVTNVGWLGSKIAVSADTKEVVQVGALELNHGNSGGPVYRIRDAAIIGIAVAFRPAPGEAQFQAGGYLIRGEVELNSGLTEIVPIREAQDLLSKLKATARVE